MSRRFHSAGPPGHGAVWRSATPLYLLAVAMVALSCTPADEAEISELKAQLEQLEQARAVQRAQVDDYATMLTELEPGGSGPTVEAEGLRTLATQVDEAGARLQLAQRHEPHQEGEPAACWGNVHTFVRSEKGTDCHTYAAEIAGWSEQCVGECDDAARLAEAVASASITCAAFCREKNCPGPRYQGPSACATSRCRPGNPKCTEEWPLFNSCFLLQETRVWNCICAEF